MFDIGTLTGVVCFPEDLQARFDPSVIESRRGTIVYSSDYAACPPRDEHTRARIGAFLRTGWTISSEYASRSLMLRR